MVNQFPGIPVTCLCNRHLISALFEFKYKLIRGTMKKGFNIDGYIERACVELNFCICRHTLLLHEAKLRGLKCDGFVLEPSDIALINKYRDKYQVTEPCSRYDELCQMFPDSWNVERLMQKSKQGKCTGKTCAERLAEAKLLE